VPCHSRKLPDESHLRQAHALDFRSIAPFLTQDEGWGCAISGAAALQISKTFCVKSCNSFTEMSLKFIICSAFVLIFITLEVDSNEGVRHYNGYSVFRLIPKTEAQLNYLQTLEENVVEVSL